MDSILVEHFLFDDKVSIFLPNDYLDMEDDLQKIIYPFTKKPELIKRNEDCTCFLTLSLLNKTLNESQILAATEKTRELVRMTNPSALTSKASIFMPNNANCGRFSFKTAFKGEVYHNVMFIKSIHQKMLLGTTSCSINDEISKETMKIIMASIKQGTIEK